MYSKYRLFYESQGIMRMHKQCVPSLSLGGGVWTWG